MPISARTGLYRNTIYYIAFTVPRNQNVLLNAKFFHSYYSLLLLSPIMTQWQQSMEKVIIKRDTKSPKLTFYDHCCLQGYQLPSRYGANTWVLVLKHA